ncbi:P-loop NTPase fold protein [Paraclostridium sordellii]|uniref:P-loop NTPase fold protein n=1 Tax=Paraclostridium sordellii TaxID=1505 RepID=UPI0022DEA406|nr:P-loop NTPase fold protein [Paeniclostridium sordellii]
MQNNSNIYNLKELYNGEINENEELILIDEESVDYDLLDRGIFINNIYNIITKCKPNKKFVISLEGAWGSGKTTILNIVKKQINENNPDIIVIDDFDPWSYNDKGSLFRGMFDTILSKTGFKYSTSKSKNMVDNLYSALFSDNNKKKIRALGIYNEDNFTEINKIKSMINSYIKINSKKLVFIIDNIDRIEKENITLIFKLVNNILDFENVTYVLAFDDKKIKEIMRDDLKIEYDYLKKIVQLEVKVPKIDSSVINNVISKCIKNLLCLYGVRKENLKEFDSLINQLSILIHDVRDLKRFINSAISFNYKSNKYLNSIEILTIELIKMYNIELYIEIWNNKKFFISHDKEFLGVDALFVDKNKFNREGKEYFDRLFSDKSNKKYENILAEIFPYVNKYKSNQDLEYNGSMIIPREEEYKSIIRNKSICSAKFFELYFTQNNNEFIYISNKIEAFIKYINISLSREDSLKVFDLLINDFHKDYHKILFETMQYYIDDVNIEKLQNLLYVLYNRIYDISDAILFLQLNARQRGTIIIAEILLKIPENKFSEFIENIKNEYSNISILKDISYWIEHNKNFDNNMKENKNSILNEQIKNMVERVYDNSIDIYSDSYKRGNILSLYNVLKNEDRDVKVYVNNILNSDNIIKFIYDIVSVSIGSNGYSYRINRENLDLFTTVETIDKLISQRNCNTDDEKFVLNIYECFKLNIKDDCVEQALVYSEEVNLTL